MDLIITHNNCPDGWMAAYIAKRKYPEAQIVPVDHGKEPPYDLVKGKDVLVTDFSWRTREQNDKMHSLAKSLLILDHHKTAEQVLAGADYAIFDMNRSGAGLAWDHLFGLPRPWQVNYTEDRDLWRFALPKSKEVNAYLMTLPFTIDAYSKLASISKDEAAELGKGALSQVEHYVEKAVEQRQIGTIEGYSAAIVNALYTNISEVGNELAKIAQVGVGWFERSDGVIQFSLRSQGDIDVSKIAQKFNGGGHKNAAGFQMSIAEGRALIDSILSRDLPGFWF